MRKHQAGDQPGLAIAPWLALDCDADLASTICREPAIDCLDESTLPGQQLHLGAGQNALRNWQVLKERNNPGSAAALTLQAGNPRCNRGDDRVALAFTPL